MLISDLGFEIDLCQNIYIYRETVSISRFNVEAFLCLYIFSKLLYDYITEYVYWRVLIIVLQTVTDSMNAYR